MMPLGMAGMAGAGLPAMTMGGFGGAGLPAMLMGGFNGFMNAGPSFFGQNTPAYDFVPSWVTANMNSPTTPTPSNDDNDNPLTTGMTNNEVANTPTTTPSPPLSGPGGTRAPGDSDDAWNGGGGGHSGGGGFCIMRS